MKKISTITFHWVTNYGAVLQSYALQQYLLKLGYDTEIIDYIPLRVKGGQIAYNVRKRNTNELKKEYNISKFRRKELILSKKKYFNNKSLFKCSNKYSAVICGSDQIWNTSFTLWAEGRLTLSYYLNFLDDATKRIAYAVSFGTEKLPDEVKKPVFPEIQRFSALSAREKSGVNILSEVSNNVSLVADPTLLLEREDYEKLLHGKEYKKQDVFCYLLHDGQEAAEKTCEYTKARFNEEYTLKTARPHFGVYEWLYNIKNSNIIVTNSFHGVVFSIIFHKQFIVLPVENSGMNDRLFTLLEKTGLSDNLLETYDPEKIEKIITSPINYENVDMLWSEFVHSSKEFLITSLKDACNEN